MGSTVATECPSEHISALQPLSYQLVMTSLRLIAEVLTLVANSFSWGQQTDKLAFQAPAEPESCLFLIRHQCQCWVWAKICSLCSSPQVHLRLKNFDFRKMMIDTPGEARYTRTNLAFSTTDIPNRIPNRVVPQLDPWADDGSWQGIPYSQHDWTAHATAPLFALW